MGTRVVTAHVPDELAERVDEAAERLERSRGWIVKQALADWVALEDQRHQMTLEALASVDRCDLIDQADIDTWVGTLPE